MSRPWKNEKEIVEFVKKLRNLLPKRVLATYRRKEDKK